MDIRERHFGGIVRTDSAGLVRAVDVGDLVTRLLLFEHCFLESSLFREVPALVSAFGVEGLMTLVKATSLSIICDAMTAGQIGQTETLMVTLRRGGVLPLNSFRVTGIGIGDRERYLHDALQNVNPSLGLSAKKIKKLKAALARKVISYPPHVATAGVNEFHNDALGHQVLLRRIIAFTVRERTSIDVLPQLDVRVEDLGEGDLQVSTNLINFGLHEVVAHNLVERALLALASLDQRIHLMKDLQALTGFQHEERLLFESKVDFLVTQLDPSAQEERFHRLVHLAGLPRLDKMDADQPIDVERLLELRESTECTEFRKWLRGVDHESEVEIRDRLSSLREKIAHLVHTRSAKTVRFLASVAAGLVPGVGVAAGPGVALGDQFIVEHLIGRPGPVSFLGREYPRLFKD